MISDPSSHLILWQQVHFQKRRRAKHHQERKQCYDSLLELRFWSSAQVKLERQTHSECSLCFYTFHPYDTHTHTHTHTSEPAVFVLRWSDVCVLHHRGKVRVLVCASETIHWQIVMVQMKPYRCEASLHNQSLYFKVRHEPTSWLLTGRLTIVITS